MRLRAASAACRGVPAPNAGGPAAAKGERRRIPFRVPPLVLVASATPPTEGPASGATRARKLVPDAPLGCCFLTL